MKLGEHLKMEAESLSLPNVTLVCVDDVYPQRALKMVKQASANIDFGAVKVFASDRNVKGENESLVSISPITNIKGYDEFVFNNLIDFISTEFCMLAQLDGYPVRPTAWRDEFLDYDYIGAPWTWVSVLTDPRESFEHCPIGKCVGNSGFSIRSKKLMEVLSEYKYDFDRDGPEDEYVCRTIGDELKSKGIKFAPVELASMFSVENAMYRGQFGFHGRSTYDLNKKIGAF